MIALKELEKGPQLRVIKPRGIDNIVPFPGIVHPGTSPPVLEAPDRHWKEKTRRNTIPRATTVPEAVTVITPDKNRKASLTHEVLDNVWKVGVGETHGQAGKLLKDRILEDTNIKKIKVLGPPGVGKSTFIEQLVMSLLDKADGGIQVRLTSFDPIFQKMVKYLPRELWEKFHWEFINGSLLITSKMKGERPSRRKKIHPSREIHIDEVPFVGSNTITETDRGRSYIEKDFTEAKDKGETGGTLFVAFAAIPSTVSTTAKTRDTLSAALQQAKSPSEKLKILAQYGIDVAKNVHKKSKQKLEELVNTVIRQIRSSATKKQMAVVAEDFRQEMREVLPKFSNMSGVLDTLIDLPPGFRLSHDDAFQVKRQIYYWEHIFDGMGIPSDQRFILLNPPLVKVHRIPLSSAA